MSKFFKALEQAERERALREGRSGPAIGASGAGGEPPGIAGDAGESADRRRDPGVGHAHGTRPLAVSGQDRAKTRVEGVEEHLVSLIAPTRFEAEQYCSLQHLVEQLEKDAGLRVAAVSSPGRADGKTMTAINLAGALAQTVDARVLLVDADLRQPDVLNQLGMGDGAGPDLVGAITEPGIPLAAAVRQEPTFNLSILAARRPVSTPYELLKGARFGGLLEEARQQYTCVVVDTPPLIGVPDCRGVSRWVDGFLIVVAAHRTPCKLVEEALSVVDSSKVVGLIFNGDDRSLSRHYYAYGRRPQNGRATWWAGVREKIGRGRPSRAAR